MAWRAGETLQTLQDCLDQGSPARVFGGQRCRIEAQDIADFVGGFLPARRGGIGEVRFQLLRAKARSWFAPLPTGGRQLPGGLSGVLKFQSIFNPRGVDVRRK
jgi:hypothetical protein